MAAQVQHLYAPLFAKLYSVLEKWNQMSKTALSKELDRNFDWLLGNFTKFLLPSQASKDVISSKSSLLAEEGRELKVDQQLKSATWMMSELLALDEVQTHILLKRWKLMSKAERAEPLPLDQNGQLLVESGVMEEVLRFYFDERLYLMRCLSLLLESAQLEGATVLHKYVRRLLDAGLDKKLLSVLRTNLEGWALPGSQHGPQTAQPGALAVAKSIKSMPPFMLEAFREHLSLENRELQGLLVLVYGRWEVRCPAEQLVELTQLLRHYVFQPSLMSAAAGTASSSMAVKCMANAVLLAAMGLDRLLGLLQSGSRLTPDVLPLAARTRDLDAELRNWHVSVAAVPVLLTWSAVVQLLGWSSRTDAGSEEDQFQRDAFAAGGFEAWATIMKQEVFDPSLSYALAAREVMLTALNVVNTAYALSALTLEASLLNSVLDLISTLMAGAPELCDKFWDESDPCGAPMRSMLYDCASIFPAFYSQLVRLLAAVSTSPYGAVKADDFLRSISSMAWLHDKSDPGVQEQMGVVQVVQPRLGWSGAADVPYLSLPQDALGDVQPLPELAAFLESSKLLVRWNVDCSFGVGQLLLGARALQCVISLRAEASKSEKQDPEILQDLHDTIQLLCNIACHNPNGPTQLARIQLVGDNNYDLIQLCADAITELLQRGRAVSAGALSTVSKCLRLIQQLMEAELGHAVGVLASMPLLAAPAIEPMPAMMLGQIASVESVVPGCLGVEMGLLQAVQSELEMSQREYPVTHGFLSLLHSVLVKGCVTGPVSCWVMYALHGVLGEHPNWQYKAQRDKWRMAAAALRVLHAAVLAGARFPGPSVVRGLGGMEGEDKGDVQITHLAATVIRQMCFHGASYLANLVLVLTDVVHAAQQLGRGDLEASQEAAEALLELVPTLLCAANQFPTPTPLERFWFTPLDKAGTTPIRMLSTYIAHPLTLQRPLTRVSALSLQALHAVAAVAKARGAALMPSGLSMCTLMPMFCGEKEAVSALRKALMRPYEKSAALSEYSDMLTVGVDLLEVALEAHPALLDALLLPAPAGKGSESAPALQSATTAGASDPTPSSTQAPAGPTATTADGKKAAHGNQSALDGMWALIQDSKELWQDYPSVLADVLRAVCALWRHSAIAGAAVVVLRSKPEFWTCMGAVLQAAEESGAEASPQLAWRLKCEMYVLQLITMEQHVCTRPDPTTPESATFPDVTAFWQLLDSWSAERFGRLLVRYRETLEVPADWVIQLLCQLQSVCLDATAYGLDCTYKGFKYTDLKLIAEDLDQECQEVLQMVSRNEATLKDIKDASLILLHSDEEAGPSGMLPYASSSNPVVKALPSMKLGTALLQILLSGSISFSSQRYGSHYLMASSKLQVLGCHMSERLDKLVLWVEILNGAVANCDAGVDALAAWCTLMTLLPRDKTLLAALQQQVVSDPSGVPPPLANAARELNRGLVHFIHTSTDPRMQLARTPWGLYTLHINLLEAVHQLARYLMQVVRLWRDACASPTIGTPPGPAAWSDVSIVLVGLLKLWLRGTGAHSLADLDRDDPMVQITVCLLGSVLLALPPPQVLSPAAPSRPPPDSARLSSPSAHERRTLQRVLLDVLPELCSLCGCRGDSPLFGPSTQLLARCLQVAMPAEEWLPVVRGQLELDGLMRQLGNCLVAVMNKGEDERGEGPDGMQDGAYAGLGALQLLMVLASTVEGAVMLQGAGLMQFASTLARHLLSSEGGMLTAFTEQQMSNGLKDPGQPDYAGAYNQSSKSWSWTHQLWCTVLGVVGCLMKGLHGCVQQMESSWMAFLLVVEPRLLLACQPPAADPLQPLTRAGILELERSLLVLLQLTPCQGAWLYNLPSSLLNFRTAMTSYVRFVAHYGGAKGGGGLSCAPVSKEERRDAAVLSVFPATAGLYQACTRGSAQHQDSRPFSLPAGSPPPLLPAPSDSAPRCSEYSAGLARGMYTCLLYALMSLYATSPPYTHTANSPAWPPTSTLLSLLDQVISVMDSLIEPGQVVDKAGRRHQACVSLLRTAQLLPELLALSGHVLDRSTSERVHERVQKVERMCGMSPDP